MLDVSDDIGPAGAPAEELLGSLTCGLLIEHQRIGVGPKRLPGLLERPRNRTSPGARAAAGGCGHVFDRVRRPAHCEQESSCRRTLQSQEIQIGDVVDVHEGPSILARSNEARSAVLPGGIHEFSRNASPAAVNDGRTDYDRPNPCRPASSTRSSTACLHCTSVAGRGGEVSSTTFPAVSP
jgi:hypothetical protein